MLNIHHPVSMLKTTVKHRAIRLLEFNWWLLLVRLSKMSYRHTLRSMDLHIIFSVRTSIHLLVDQTVRWERTSLASLIHSIPSVEIGIPPWETYIASFTNLCMVSSIDYTGDFKPYYWNLYQCRHPLELKYGIQKHISLLFVSHVGAACG